MEKKSTQIPIQLNKLDLKFCFSLLSDTRFILYCNTCAYLLGQSKTHPDSNPEIFDSFLDLYSSHIKVQHFLNRFRKSKKPNCLIEVIGLDKHIYEFPNKDKEITH